MDFMIVWNVEITNNIAGNKSVQIMFFLCIYICRIKPQKWDCQVEGQMHFWWLLSTFLHRSLQPALRRASFSTALPVLRCHSLGFLPIYQTRNGFMIHVWLTVNCVFVAEVEDLFMYSRAFIFPFCEKHSGEIMFPEIRDTHIITSLLLNFWLALGVSLLLSFCHSEGFCLLCSWGHHYSLS